jgi:LCP family protein required for cell wall assembly
MTRRRTLAYAILAPPLCGVLVATLVAAAWLAVGRPLPAGAAWLTVTKVDPLAGAEFEPYPPGVHFFVVFGNDARDPEAVGLGDALKVIGVNADAKAATIINIPRDTAVPIAGGSTNKINSASSTGGVARMAETVSSFVGVPITFAMTANFAQFINLVNEMGGVDINILEEMHDSNSGADFAAGPAHLDGEQALAFSRDRYSFGSGDIRRTENQGYLIISALQTLRSRNLSGAGVLNSIATLVRHVEVENAGLVDLYRIGRLALQIDPANVRNVVIPTGGGSGSNLAPGPGIDALFADFRDDAVLQSN